MSEKSPNLDRSLHNFVNKFRQDIEPCWNKSTAYKHFGTAGSPEGQCVVTSRVLKDALYFQGLLGSLEYCVGKVTVASVIAIPYHMWLEDSEGLIIDVTADQAPALPYSVIVNNRLVLGSLGVDYLSAQTNGVVTNHFNEEVERRYLELHSLYHTAKVQKIIKS